MNIPFVDLKAQYQTIEPEIQPAINQVLSRCNFILGAEVEEFEKNYGQFIHVRHAVGVSSGLDALRLAMAALDMAPATKSSYQPTPISPQHWLSAPSVRSLCW